MQVFSYSLPHRSQSTDIYFEISVSIFLFLDTTTIRVWHSPCQIRAGKSFTQFFIRKHYPHCMKPYCLSSHSRARLIQSTSYFFMINFNIILTSFPRYSKWFFFFHQVSPPTKPLHLYSAPYVPHGTRPSSSPWVHHPNNIWWRSARHTQSQGWPVNCVTACSAVTVCYGRLRLVFCPHFFAHKRVC